MQDSRIPQATGAAQPLKQTALDGFPSCLVDDPVFLVDDSRVLTGSPTTSISDIKIGTSTNAPTMTSTVPTFKTSTKSNAPSTTVKIRQ